MRDGNAVAEAGRAKLLALQQCFENHSMIDGGMLACRMRDLLQSTMGGRLASFGVRIRRHTRTPMCRSGPIRFWISLALRSAPVLWWWLLPLLIGMELSFVRVNGYWVAGFRNFRHAHVFVYPIVLLVAGYLAALRQRAPRLAPAMLAMLLVASLYEAVKTADVTHTAFGDGRAVCNFVAGQPAGTIYLDAVLINRCTDTNGEQMRRWRVNNLPPDPPIRARLLEQAEPGAYAVTGGAREPVYTGPHFVPREVELPLERFQSVLERGGPVSEAWRPEPLRIWRVEAWPGQSACFEPLPYSPRSPAGT